MFKRNVTQGYFVPASVLSMYEEGGELRYQEGAQTPDKMQQAIEMAMTAVQNEDANMAMEACRTLVMAVQEAQGGDQEEAADEMEDMGEEMPAEQVPMARQGMEIYDDNQDLMY